MAYLGYYKYGGVEIINMARVRAYQQNLNIAWLTPGYDDSDQIPAMLGESYETPFLDPAPWVDDSNIESTYFYGLYPLSITGIDDSTRDAQVTESILDGGVAGRIRNATRSIVFEAALLAGSEPAVEYGLNWLKKVLLGRGCLNTTACSGSDLEFFSAAPFYDPFGPADPANDSSLVLARLDGGYWIGNEDQSVDSPLIDGGDPTTVFSTFYDGGTPAATGGELSPPYPDPFGPEPVPPFSPADCLVEFQRHLRNVTFTTGPTVTRKKKLTSGDHVWFVQFTAVAASPWQFGAEIDILSGFLGPAPQWGTSVSGGTITLSPVSQTDMECPTTVFEPLVDPLCPALIAPPTVPAVDLNCFDPPTSWLRRQFTIPGSKIPQWLDVVPLVRVAADFADLRNLRIRFYTDNGTHVVSDNCDMVADMLFSYLPMDYTMVVDAAAKQIYVIDPDGNQRRADSLVFSSDGSPFEWPLFSCDSGLVVAADLPAGQVSPVIDVSLMGRTY